MTVELRTLRVSAEMDASGYVAASNQKVAADKAMSASGKEAAAGIAAVGGATQSTETKVSNTANVMERLSRQFVDGYGTAQRATAAVNALSREIDKTGFDAARVQPILDGIYRKYGQLADASVFAARGQTQLAAAITDTTARLQTQEAVIERRGGRVPLVPREREFQSPWGQAAPTNTPVAAANDNRFNTANIAAQFQDIGVTAAMGMNPLQIALQQGTQLSMVFEQMKGTGQSAGAALLGAFTSIISPLSLLTIGAVAASAAALQYFSTWKKEGKSLDGALTDHEKAIRNIGDAYGYAAQQQKASGLLTGRGADVLSAASAQQLQLGINTNTRDVLGEISQRITPGRSAGGYFTAIPEFKEFDDAIKQLRKTAADGTPDIEEFRRAVSERWALDPLNNDLTTAAGKLLEMTNNAMQAASAIKQLERMRLDRVDAYRQYGMSREAGPGSAAAAAELKRRLDGESDAAMQADMRARTFAERFEAARMNAAAGDPIGRADRIRVAELEERTRYEVELRDALQARSDAQRSALEQAELERLSIGKSAGEIARLNAGYQDFVKLREDSERTGLPISDAALENVKEFAKAMGEAADATARLRLENDLQFEREQMFRTSGEQAIASRLRGTGISLNSATAQQMRDNARFADAKEITAGFFSDLRAAFQQNGGDIGEAFAQAALNATNKILDRMMENIIDQLASGFASAFTGVKPGVAGSAFAELGGGLMGMLGYSAANDNYSAPVGAVTRMPLPAIGAAGNTRGGIPLASISTANGLVAQVNAAFAERFQGFINELEGTGYQIKSLGGYNYRNIAGSSRLSNHAYGNAIDINPATNPDTGRGGALITDMPPGVSDIASKYGIGWGGDWRSKKDAMHFEILSKQAEAASAGIDKMTTNAIGATKGLGELGGGLQQIGGALSQFPAAPPASGGGGGGLFGWLGGLFGGGGASLSPSAWNVVSSGGMTGFFANGTENAPPGWAWVGERGPELMRMRGGETIRSNAASMAMAAGGTVYKPQINIAPPAGYQADVDEESDEGGEKINVRFSKMMASEAGRHGSPFNKRLRSMGAQERRVKR